jgi:hypothetical protein
VAAPWDQGTGANANLSKEQPMPFSHTDLLRAIPEMEQLLDLIGRRLSLEPEEASGTQADFERELRMHTLSVERAVHVQDFERLDIDAPGIIVDGVRYIRRSVKTIGQYMSLAGAIEVSRSTYRQRGGHGGETVAAIDLRLGLIGGHWTPTAAKAATTFMASCPSVESATLLEAAGTMTPSSSHLDRVAKLVGGLWEARRVEFEVEVRQAESLDLPTSATVAHIVLSLDGVMVPMKDAPRIPGLGKKDQGPKGHKEASSGTLSLYGQNGERLRTIRFGRMPERHKATLHRQLVDELAPLRARYPDATVVAVADGAHENWRIFDEIAAELGCKITRRLDYFHAMEHLIEGLSAAGAEDTVIAEWSTRLKDEPGVIEPLIEEICGRATESGKVAIERCLNFFLNNADRIDYAEAAAAGQPIGSGVQEAACKTLVTQRMKRSGMSWRTPGGQAILTLRGLAQSNRLAHAWNAIRPTLPKRIQVDPSQRRKLPQRQAA